MKIGILGGTFDPPHLGHLSLARAALSTLALDEVLFLPASRNPLKKGAQSPPKQRLEMVKLAISGEPKMAVSDIEIQRGGSSYAYDTLQELTFVQPAEYWFLLGSDSLKDISRWKNPDKLLRMCRLGVVIRATQNRDQLMATVLEQVKEVIDWIEMPSVDISATDIRYLIEIGKPAAPWLRPEVLQYIQDHKLYRR